MQTSEKNKTASVTHEVFCLPRPGASEPRMEGFISYEDDVYGKSRPAARVTRCLECGATTYEAI